MPFEIHNKMSKQKLSFKGKDSAEIVGVIFVYFPLFSNDLVIKFVL